MPELIFTVAESAAPQHAFAAAALSDEVAQQDASATLIKGPLPELRPDRVFVAVGVPGGLSDAPEPVRAHTILISLSHPGTAEFEAEVALSTQVGMTLHANFAVALDLHAKGVRIGHLQLGFHREWASCDPAADRPVDLVRDEPGSRLEEAKLAVVSAGREQPCFDWPLALRAIHAGAVVLHERGRGMAPLAPGRHLFVAAPESATAVAEALLEEPTRLREVAAEARLFIERLLPMSIGAAALLGQARTLVVQPQAVG